MRKMSYKKIAAFVLAGTMAIGMSATALGQASARAQEKRTFQALTSPKKWRQTETPTLRITHLISP